MRFVDAVSYPQDIWPMLYDAQRSLLSECIRNSFSTFQHFHPEIAYSFHVLIRFENDRIVLAYYFISSFSGVRGQKFGKMTRKVIASQRGAPLLTNGTGFQKSFNSEDQQTLE